MEIKSKLNEKYETFQVKEIIYVKEMNGYKIVFKDVFPKPDENDVMYYDLCSYAVVKTMDDKIRECVSYIDFCRFEWMDLNSEKEYFIVNYEKYLDTMKMLDKPPSNFTLFIKERYDGLCDASCLMKMDMSL